MSQLKSLYIWATHIEKDDLQYLAQLKKIEYLSLGDVENCCDLTYSDLEPFLKQMLELKRLWLDGIKLTED